MRERLIGGICFALALTTGCADRSQRAVMVTDSAGVEIVTNLNGSVEAVALWSLSPDPVVVIGAGANPDVPLYRVSAVEPLGDGRVAVGTNTPPQGLLFERDGTLAATIGRVGEGPGEFSSVGSLVHIPPDTIGVWDPNRRRVSVFTEAGSFTREVDLSTIAPLTAAATPNSQTDAGFTHLFASKPGSLVLFGEGVFSSSAFDGIARPELPAYRIGPTGERLSHLGSFPGLTVFAGSPMGTLPLPLGARTYATASEGALVVGTADETEFRVIDPAGSVTRIVRWPDTDRPVAGPHLATWQQMVDSQPAMKELVQAFPKPDRLPAYEGILSSDDGEIFVGAYEGPLGVWPMRRADHGPDAFRPVRRVPERRWLIFDSDGALAASVRTPEGFEPYAIRESLMWGVYSDELDVESVRAYQLIKHGPS